MKIWTKNAKQEHRVTASGNAKQDYRESALRKTKQEHRGYVSKKEEPLAVMPIRKDRLPGIGFIKSRHAHRNLRPETGVGQGRGCRGPGDRGDR